MTTAFVVSRVEAELVKAIFDKDGQNVPHMTGAVLHVPTNSVQLFVKAIIDFQNDSSEQEYLADSLTQKGWFYSQEQRSFNLVTALAAAKNYRHPTQKEKGERGESLAAAIASLAGCR